ncbi:hypothetical protein Tcan_17738 [Toxocara canis]|uniref:Uncharacterized protein n=1 Tax=Toxocara canis TaxID=6265 RepID=A0A0B2VV45_TOXCA|nr:hypothetical protein Tcan_17738 [Toxocara canis]
MKSIVSNFSPLLGCVISSWFFDLDGEMRRSIDLKKLADEMGSLRAIVVIVALMFCLFIVIQLFELLFQIFFYRKRARMVKRKRLAIEPAPEIVIDGSNRRRSSGKKRKARAKSRSKKARHSSESQPSKKDTLRISLCHGDTEETATAFDPRALKERSEVMEEKENSSTSGNNVKGAEVWHAIPKDSLRVTSPAQLVPLPHSAGTVAIPDSTTTSPVPREAVAKDSLMHVLANAPLVPVAYDAGTVAIPDSTTTSPVPREAVAKDSLMHVLANAPLVPVAYDGSSSSNVLNVKSGGQSSSRSGKNSESSRGDLSVEVSGSAEMGAILSDDKAAHRKANM